MFQAWIENYISRQLTIYYSAKVDSCFLPPLPLSAFPPSFSLHSLHARLGIISKGSPCLVMDIELHSAVSLQEDTFNVLVAPPEMLVDAINTNLNLQRYKVLFISGNYSRILSRLNRNITELDVRRAFTSFQLMTILEENHHSFLIVEHDPMLYEDAGQMVEYLAQALKQTSREATVLLYAPPALDPFRPALQKDLY
jgi:hypothetical protein